MTNEHKTKAQLTKELEKLRRRVAKLESKDAQHKRDKEALRESEEKYRTVLEASTDAVFLETLEGEVLDCNASALRMYGYTKKELVGLTVADLVPEEVAKMLPDVIKEHLEKGGILIEAVGKRKNGSVFPTEVSTRLVKIGGENLVATFVRDITERKEAEEQRRKLEAKIERAHKLESLAILSAGAAHDFSNLATRIICDAGLIRLQIEPDERAAKSIESIENACRRAGELCEHMLAYSGEKEPEFGRLNLNSVVEEMVSLLKSTISDKAELTLDLDQNLPDISADATQIRQVVMNLLTNAAEAIVDETGTIIISTSKIQCDRAFLEGTVLDYELEEGTYICLEVTDTGHGMDMETIEKVFDPFFTKKVTGRGLGLASVLGIIRQHDGTIKVHSQPGKGTTFKVFFPVAKQPAK